MRSPKSKMMSGRTRPETKTRPQLPCSHCDRWKSGTDNTERDANPNRVVLPTSAVVDTTSSDLHECRDRQARLRPGARPVISKWLPMSKRPSSSACRDQKASAAAVACCEPGLTIVVTVTVAIWIPFAESSRVIVGSGISRTPTAHHILAISQLSCEVSLSLPKRRHARGHRAAINVRPGL